jgi:hypothetical protein
MIQFHNKMLIIILSSITIINCMIIDDDNNFNNKNKSLLNDNYKMKQFFIPNFDNNSNSSAVEELLNNNNHSNSYIIVDFLFDKTKVAKAASLVNELPSQENQTLTPLTTSTTISKILSTLQQKFNDKPKFVVNKSIKSSSDDLKGKF